MRVSNGAISVSISKDEYMLINAYTGGIDLVDQDVIDLLKEIASSGKAFVARSDEDALKILVSRGYVTDMSTEEEISVLEKLFRKNVDAMQRCKQHRVILTYDCNLRCKYCYERHLQMHGIEWLKKSMRKDEADMLYDCITALDAKCDQTEKQITLYGGEPFLPQNIEIVKYIMKKGLKLGYRFFAVTNGLSLKEQASELRKDGLDGVQVTLDGPKDVHDKRRYKADGSGTFEEIIESIEEARNAGLQISIRIMFDASNVSEVTQFVDFAIERGWHRDERILIYLANVFEHARGDYSYTIPWEDGVLKMIDIAKRNKKYEFLVKGAVGVNPIGDLFTKGEWLPRFFGCQAHCNQLFYDCHGDIYSCWKIVGQREHSVGRFIPSPHFNDNYKVWLKRNVFNMPKCRACPYISLCGGGCAIVAYENTGSLMSPNCMGILNYFNRYVLSLYDFAHMRKVNGENVNS
jgi:uncharacterized protein